MAASGSPKTIPRANARQVSRDAASESANSVAPRWDTFTQPADRASTSGRMSLLAKARSRSAAALLPIAAQAVIKRTARNTDPAHHIPASDARRPSAVSGSCSAVLMMA
ncbi:MAG TPA: hypothetical protein VK163_09920 [Opitutaceae bacterium]|nr:hypothetical protein [Opitutaceae bacterium]